MSRIQGTVKWFSNKKGYGFIEPTSDNAPTTEDIFVHQSSITSDGYRTLFEGWEVEFDAVNDDEGKLKADNVTAVGGGPCTGPRPERRPRPKRTGDDQNETQEQTGGGGGGGDNEDGEQKQDGAAKKRNPKPKVSRWHHTLNDEVKESLKVKSIRHVTGTIDVAVDNCRVKLGTKGYVSLASSDVYLAEGSFTCDESGVVIFKWERALEFDGEWKSKATDGLLATINLTDDNVVPVGMDETAETLFGGEKPDPLTALEANGFQMRRVVLTSKGKGKGPRKENKTEDDA
mmetsp:Transcript_41970/g.58962  ORF Transcript_41970/g.58962 Transcript_41970/m.58962 type:complete len:288 (-) Transcript_41970:138-1001(-)